MRATFLLLLALQSILYADEKAIVIVIPSYNNKEYYKDNLDSVINQNYQNFHILYIDDDSTDGTGSLVQEYIREKKLDAKITLIQNKKRLKALQNIYNAVRMCNPTDIIVTVDGDDFLFGTQVLQHINHVYSDPNVWMTYGQKIDYPSGFFGGAENIPTHIIQTNSFRQHEWTATHLRTFYAGLFQKIHKEDLLYENDFFSVAWDLAFMFPMLEMAGTHSLFIPDALYMYNVDTPLSDNKLYREQQIFLDSFIREKKPYQPLETLFPSKTYVTCDIRGGLGNQLFQIATTLAYAWDHHVIPIFPDLNRSEVRISNNKDQIFSRLHAPKSSNFFQSSFLESNWHTPETIPFQQNQKLFGYFQSWQYFHHHREQLLSTLAPSSEILRYLSEKYEELILNTKTVSIHVRTFNETLHNSKHHPFLGLDYYKKAIEHYPADSIFVVFSDRIQWCKQNFATLGKQFVFIEGNDPVQDLFLMSMMKHHIIANSTYSWWGAYLNKNQDKIVIAPSSWMHPDVDPFPEIQPNSFYLPDWKLVTPDYSAPYPQDITQYEATTDDSIFH